MGYWIAQQDVARGNQPWYYYFIGLSVYELLPLAFGIAGIIYFLRRRDILGLALALWAVLSLAAYTVATEKMPWLLVNITTPFILVAAKFLGELAGRVDWPGILRRGGELMIVGLLWLTPFIAAAAVYLLLHYLDPERPFGMAHWLLLASIIAAAIVAAYVYRAAGPGRAAPGRRPRPSRPAAGRRRLGRRPRRLHLRRLQRRSNGLRPRLRGHPAHLPPSGKRSLSSIPSRRIRQG